MAVTFYNTALPFPGTLRSFTWHGNASFMLKSEPSDIAICSQIIRVSAREVKVEFFTEHNYTDFSQVFLYLATSGPTAGRWIEDVYHLVPDTDAHQIAFAGKELHHLNGDWHNEEAWLFTGLPHHHHHSHETTHDLIVWG